ncbi:putative uncharacterized protein [[Ruminococcus] torques CAG:61]|uniref:Uncharacterized protein n=1 Tax=[Ruminococcus] torques CAG:61 TaxID=1263108 RepID=R5QX51_9FIRM|nr:putative uncharacterized protein [[Ruminococcus] torques CAG:61]
MGKNQDLSSGKMSPEHSAPTREKTSVPSSKRSAKSKTDQCQCLSLQSGTGQEKSWEIITPLPGDSLMLSFGEYPREENVSTLSQILMAGVPEKYYLSQKACLGILRRASLRGKELPLLLKKALEMQASA